MKILGVIPARFASTRFPGKPLALLGGMPMIERVYHQVRKSAALAHVVVATDHPEIFETVKSFGEVVFTSPHHPSGTDRCFEALKKTTGSFDFVINVQGDEPFIDPRQIDLLASILRPGTALATLIKKLDDPTALHNPHVVKVVRAASGRALYFSRSAIPFVRDVATDWLSQAAFYKHIGMYAYRTDVLEAITQLPVSSLEKAESLEQLRWLENGYAIETAITDLETTGIDTPDDLARAEILLQNRD